MDLTNRIFNLQLLIEAMIEVLVTADVTTHEELKDIMERKAEELQEVIDQFNKQADEGKKQAEHHIAHQTPQYSGSVGSSIFTFGKDNQGQA